MKKSFRHHLTFFIFLLLVSIAVLATVLPWLHSKEWYIRIFDYPRLQTFILAIAALVWYAVFHFQKKPKGFIILAILCGIIAVQGYKAFPYTPLGAKQVLWSEKDPADSMHISFFISNVLQHNSAYELMLQKIQAYQPDIVITTETDKNWQAGLSALEKDYQYQIAVPKNNTYGMILYSRLPLRQNSVRYLLEKDIPSIRTEVRLRSGQWVHLFIVHPRPPFPGEADDTQQRDAEIIMVAKEARKAKGGVIVAGDFNDVAWSETTELFQEVSGFLDPRRGRGFYNTFHAKIPVFRWPLDHIFHSVHFKLVTIERAGSVNSDHFPVYVKLSYEPQEQEEQERIKPEEDTEEQAKETIREGRKKE